jgi:hypothetical protein
LIRAFDFKSSAPGAARWRQYGLCAHCGESLDDVMDHAHHVIPNQIGRINDPADAFLRDVDNCVILCEDCHWAAHSYGQYRLGAVAIPGWFRYSHGKAGRAQHATWARMLDSEWERLSNRQ